MRQSITITHPDLTAALKDWDAESRANSWPTRTDPARFEQAADYLIDKIAQAKAVRNSV